MSQKNFYSSFKQEKKSIYIFTGNDSFLRKQIVNFLKKELEDTHILRKFSFDEEGFKEAVNLYKNTTLFGEKYCIYGKSEEFSNKEKKIILTLIEENEKHDNENIFIIFFEKLKSNDKIVKSAKAKNCFFQLNPPSSSQLRQYIYKFFQQKNIPIEPNVPEFLMETLNNNLEAISLELKKIIDSHSEQGRITVDYLKKTVLSTKEETIFNLVNSFLNGNGAKTLELYHRLTELNTDTDSIITIFLSTINTMILVKDAKVSGLKDSEIISKFKIHPYSFKKNLEMSQKYTVDELYLLFEKLIKTQVTVRSKGIDKKLIFRNFILSECKK